MDIRLAMWTLCLILGFGCRTQRPTNEAAAHVPTENSEPPRASEIPLEKVEVSLGPSKHAPQDTSSAAPPTTVDHIDPLASSMQGFARAIEQRDVEALLGYFSKRGFTFMGTIEKPYKVERIKYADLARDLQSRDPDEGWYAALLGDEDDSFFLCVAGAEGRPWKRVGARKFVLPYDDADSKLFVLWRKEGRRWVVDTIAKPDA